jgi:pyruvate dehydrogenase E1 component alpha subunit
MDLWSLYALMAKSRRFEEAVTQLWQDGLISGEMHLGTGEEGIIAGIIDHLQPEDAIALDHRGSAAFLMRGVDPVLLLREMLGYEDGLCGGQGGHMHLYSQEHLAASSGIVGAAGPTAVGFALAAQHLRPSSIAIAFFGEGAMNQGMLMESINLAAVWNLPVLFVCKDDEWAITTKPDFSIGGDLGQRVRGLGAEYMPVNGLNVEQVWEAANQAIEHIRAGNGPAFLHASCVHFEGHFLGLLLIRMIRKPLRELPAIVWPLVRSFLQPKGSSFSERLTGLRFVLSTIVATLQDPRREMANDPVARTRQTLMSDPQRLEEIDQGIEAEIASVITMATREPIA